MNGSSHKHTHTQKKRISRAAHTICVRYRFQHRSTVSQRVPALTYVYCTLIIKMKSIWIVSEALPLMKCAAVAGRRERERAAQRRRKKKNRTKKSLRGEQKAHRFMHFHSTSTWHSMSILFVHFFFLPSFSRRFFFVLSLSGFGNDTEKTFWFVFLRRSRNVCGTELSIMHWIYCFLLVSHLPSGIRLATLFDGCELWDVRWGGDRIPVHLLGLWFTDDEIYLFIFADRCECSVDCLPTWLVTSTTTDKECSITISCS